MLPHGLPDPGRPGPPSPAVRLLVEGNPAQLYRFDPDEVEKIAVDLYQGEVTFLITEPAEIQRFVEKSMAFPIPASIPLPVPASNSLITWSCGLRT